MKHVILFFFFIFQLAAFAQVVNIENQYLEDGKDGFSGALDLSLSVQKQKDALVSLRFKPIFQYRFGKSKIQSFNQNKDDITIDSLAQIEDTSTLALRLIKKLSQGKHLLLLYHDINYTASKGVTYTNFGLSHLRYVYTIANSSWRSESYSQIQYNQLLLQKIRYLLGTGIRANIFDIGANPGGYTERVIRISAGTSVFFEYNEINHKDRPLEKTRALRWDTYLSTYFNFKFMEFTSTTNIQPNLGDFKDFRASGDYSFLFRVSTPFSVKFNFSFYYDAKPPEGTPDNTYALTAGFVYKLNRFKENIRAIKNKYQDDKKSIPPKDNEKKEEPTEQIIIEE